jgi:hypothetical protein
LGILFPPGDSASLTVGLPATPDPNGVSMFRTGKTRLGSGALCTPGTTVSTWTQTVYAHRLPHHSGNIPTRPTVPFRSRTVVHDEASARVSGQLSPTQPSPHL